MNDPRAYWNQIATAPAKRKRASDSRPSKSPRWAMLNAFVDHRMRHLGRAALAVWLVLYRETNREGLSRITVEQIAEKTGLGVSMVKLGLRELRAMKMVVQVSRGNRNKGPSTYRLLPISTVGVPTIEPLPPTAGVPAIEPSSSIVDVPTVEGGKHPFSTAGVPTTATAGVPTTPQKEQEPGPPLGASAGPGDEEKNGHKSAHTLRVAACPNPDGAEPHTRGGP